jgi:D-sedoheptulose 7-phosphate isomerase
MNLASQSVNSAPTALTQQFQDHVARTREILDRIDYPLVQKVVERLYEAYVEGQRVFIYGNGGSAATASHIAEDLAKSTVKDASVEKRLRVQSLSDATPFITALGNDWGYDTIYREQLITLASAGDVSIAISGSGNSPNIVNATRWAREKGLFTVGLTGFNGGKLKGMVDVAIHSPILDMEIAENAHMIVGHLFVGGLRSMVAAAASA